MKEPDFDALQAVNADLRKLADDGELTQASFDALLKQAEEAVGEHTEFLEGILMRGAEHGFVKL